MNQLQRPLQRCCFSVAKRTRYQHRIFTSASTSKPPPLMDMTKSFGVGTVAGICGSMAGLGGGFVMIPLLTSRTILGLSQHQAHGTSLAAVAATGVAGAVSYSTLVNWPEAAAVAVTGIVSARFGAQSAARLSGPALKRALGVLMLLMAPAVHLKQYIKEQQQPPDDQEQVDAIGKDETTQPVATSALTTNNSTTLNKSEDHTMLMLQRVAPASAIGVASGYMAGLFGVGGGVIVVPALTLFTDCNHYQALATSLAAMVLPAAAGTYTHFQAGNVATRVAPGLALGACLGAFVGGQVAQHYAQESTLRWGFSGVLAVLGVRTLLKA